MALNARSTAALANAHPLLKSLFAHVQKDYPNLKFQILESRRGEKDQEKAFAAGNSKAHFGQSPHNYTPAVALDITPLPLDWNDIKAFKALSVPILATAKKLSIPISWGGSWKSFKDYPHYELTPWRDYAAKSKLFGR